MDRGQGGELGYLATECPLGLDIQAEMESIQSFYNNDSKKLTQLSAPPRQPGDISFYNRSDPIDLCTFTSVSSDESKLLEDFMTLASDFGPKERPTLTELTVCDRTGNLSRQGSCPGEMPALQTTCTVTSLSSLPGQYGTGSQYSGQHHHRDKYPAKRRLHSSPFASSPTKPMKLAKPSRSMSAGEAGGENRDMSGGGGMLATQHGIQPNMGPIHPGQGTHSGQHPLHGGQGMHGGQGQQAGQGLQGGSSLLRAQLQGTLCANKYKTAITTETLCKDCGMPFTAKCLLQVCRKSDEVLCPLCGQELTAKCLLSVCKSDTRPGSV